VGLNRHERRHERNPKCRLTVRNLLAQSPCVPQRACCRHRYRENGIVTPRSMPLDLPGWIVYFSVAVVILLGGLTSCSSNPQPTQKLEPSATSTTSEPDESLQSAESAAPEYALHLPPSFGHWTGDWDVIQKHHILRMLVLYNKTGFFYDKGRPRGVVPEIAEEMDRYLNKRLKRGAKKFKVAFIPVSPAQLETYLNDGSGDVIASLVIATPEREKRVDFSMPIVSGEKVRLVVVTGKNTPQIAKIDDLSGQEIYVNPVTLSYTLLQEHNQKLKQAGKPEIIVKESDPNLTDEDLLEMTNAGIIPATVVFDYRADLWSVVLPDIIIHRDIALSNDANLAWAMRKNSPQLKAVLDDFLKGHRQGTLFGRMMFKKYYENKKFIKNATSQAEMKKFQSYVKYFQKYAAEYNFDYLMLAAQGYQESMLQQERVSPRGAVGIMQVLPQYAAARPINIPNVRKAEPNIHAGTKMLAQITKTYFNDPAITPIDKTLLTFAAYNAGPSRIARLRKEAASEGLDPNKWFGNVELIVAKDIGQETVQYVSNIYKYYVAYKMAVEQRELRESAKKGAAGK
jgi:membrane-bound lytic murein transglycosylase MltF